MRKRLSVTIGIPAYNEEHTIRAVLACIMQQNKRSFDLRSVVVIDDNSTDNTEQVIKDFRTNFPLITYIRNKRRIGKSSTLTKMFQKNKSDVFVVLDADIILASRHFISRLVKPFRNKEVGLVAACDKPQNPKTFFEKIVVTGVELWDDIRHEIENGNSIHNVHGSGYALSKTVCKNLHIPKNNLNDDQYVYLRVKQFGYTFQHTCSAVLYYCVPRTAADYLAQSARFMKGAEIVTKIFGSYAVFEFTYASYIRFLAIAKFFIKKPFYLPFALLFQVFMRLFKHNFETDFSNRYWRQIVSTKQLRKVQPSILKRIPIENLILSMVQADQHHIVLKQCTHFFAFFHKLTLWR